MDLYNRLESFTRRHNLRHVQIESICRRKNEGAKLTIFCHRRVSKHYGKRRKCWLPAFSPFPIMFSKGCMYRVNKSRDCLHRKELAYLLS